MIVNTATPPVLDKHVTDRHQAPVPFVRLLRVQLRAWRSQRAVVWLTVLATVLGLAGTALVLAVGGGPPPSAGAVRDKFEAAARAYALLWVAIGVMAGTAPYRAGWASVILGVAPRRLRWLSASYVAVLGWALAATVAFAALAVPVGMATLALRGHDVGAVTGVMAEMPWLTARVVLGVIVGFGLGAASGAVTAPLLLVYVVSGFIPLLDNVTRGVARWVDVSTATEVVSGTQHAPHGNGPVVVALAVWTVLPALAAAYRLRRRDLRETPNRRAEISMVRPQLAAAARAALAGSDARRRSVPAGRAATP
jgi:ABC-2 type transport system permease protein